MLTALSAIASEQALPPESTIRKAQKFIDYTATHPDAVLTYCMSDMLLAVHSDASYLSKPKARSRAGRHFFLASNVQIPANNGAVLNTANLIKTVISSAAEAEMGAIFLAAREAIPARNTLIEMGHPQGKTPIQTENSTAYNVCNKNMQCRRSKSWDMRFFWMRCKEPQKMFRVYWRPGTTNLADYQTKHHPAAHHRNVQAEFLTTSEVVNKLRLSL